MTKTITPMTAAIFAERLRALQNKFHEEVVHLVMEAQTSHGLDIATDEAMDEIATDDRVENVVDDIVTTGGWVADRIRGINRLHRKSLTKKLRRALGYTCP